MLPDLVPLLLPAWRALPTPTSRLIGPGGLAPKVPRHTTVHADLWRAGIPRVDGAGRHADFHSFRYTFCRLLSETMPIQKVKVLMRHSSITLTADLYGQLGIDDIGDEVWSLPPLGI
jgi:integrase